MSGCWPDLCLSCCFCSSAAGPRVHLRDRMRIPTLPPSCSISKCLIHCRGWSTDLTPRSKTTLGPTSEWPQSLTSYVNLIKALPHPAAVFWGSQLSLVHNFAWGAATNYHEGQGHPAIEYYRGESRSALQSAVTGRSVRIGTC